MSEFTTRKITDRAGTGAPSFTYGLNSGGSDSGLIGKAYTSSGTEPSSPANGDLWYDSDNDKLYYYVAGEFKQITHSNAVTKIDSGSRATIHGGWIGSASNTIEYFDIGTLGNASDFGDLTHGRYNHAGGSDGTTGFSIGGTNGSNRVYNIDRWTIATTANATDHGDLTNRPEYPASNCDGTIMVVCTGTNNSSTLINVLERFTTASASNASDHGDMTVAREYNGGGISNGTIGTFQGGNTASGTSNLIEQVILATASNATDFGDMTTAALGCVGTSNHVRGVFSRPNGGTGSNVLEYITIATAGNSTDFGDLSGPKWGPAACANLDDRGVFCGGNDPYGNQGGSNAYRRKEIDYITISTTGNAADFGDLAAQVSNFVSGSSGAAS